MEVEVGHKMEKQRKTIGKIPSGVRFEIVRGGRGVYGCGCANPSRRRRRVVLTTCTECIAGSKCWVNHAISPLGCFLGKCFELHTPHPGNELTETAKEAGHADAGVTGGNTTDLEVV